MNNLSLPSLSHRSFLLLSEVLSFSHFILVVLAGFLALKLTSSFNVMLTLSFDEAIKIIILVAVFIFVSLRKHKIKATFSFRKDPFSNLKIIGIIITSFTVVALLDPAATFSKGDNIYWFASWFSLTTVFIFLCLSLKGTFLKKLVLQGSIQRKVAVFGAGEIAKKVHDHLQISSSNVVFSGLYDDRKKERVDSLGLSIEGNLKDLVILGQKNKVDQIIITLPQTAHKRIAYIASQLEQLPLDIDICTHIADDIFSHPSREMHVSTIGSIGLLTIKKKPISEWGQLQKKVLDYSLSTIALLLLSPILALIAVAIKLESSGPVIFRQKRHGLNHQKINVFKFRTMRVQENGSTVRQAQKNDPRITKVGSILRKTSLDELPQLVNILRGEMSLVGPRPHAIVHNDEYAKIIEEYANRHQVRPGLTGWAQVNGQRGETKEVKDMEERIFYDLEYINDWSFFQDIKIILMTPFYALMSKNAY